MINRYRKKSVEVRAWKIGTDEQEPDWVRKAFDDGRIVWCQSGDGVRDDEIEALLFKENKDE